MDIVIIGEGFNMGTSNDPIRGISFCEDKPAKRMTNWGFGVEYRASESELKADDKVFIYIMRGCYTVRNNFSLHKGHTADVVHTELISSYVDSEEFISHNPRILCVTPNNEWNIRKLKVFVDNKLISEANFTYK